MLRVIAVDSLDDGLIILSNGLGQRLGLNPVRHGLVLAVAKNVAPDRSKGVSVWNGDGICERIDIFQLQSRIGLYPTSAPAFRTSPQKKSASQQSLE